MKKWVKQGLSIKVLKRQGIASRHRFIISCKNNNTKINKKLSDDLTSLTTE